MTLTLTLPLRDLRLIEAAGLLRDGSVVCAAAWSKCPTWQGPSSARVPPQGAPGGSARLEIPRARGPATGRTATALRCSSQPPPTPPTLPPLTIQAQTMWSSLSYKSTSTTCAARACTVPAARVLPGSSTPNGSGRALLLMAWRFLCTQGERARRSGHLLSRRALLCSVKFHMAPAPPAPFCPPPDPR